jgi:hypothetical protein
LQIEDHGSKINQHYQIALTNAELNEGMFELIYTIFFRKFIDIKNAYTYNNIRRKACFSSGLTLKSDMLVNHVIGRWRTTLKSDIFTSF